MQGSAQPVRVTQCNWLVQPILGTQRCERFGRDLRIQLHFIEKAAGGQCRQRKGKQGHGQQQEQAAGNPSFDVARRVHWLSTKAMPDPVAAEAERARNVLRASSSRGLSTTVPSCIIRIESAISRTR